MQAEIISIGTELTSGQNLDTNSQWLSQRLAEIGIPVGWHTTVADDLDANIEVFRIAAKRAPIVLATGGLGPTQDDLTRDALARLGNVALELNAGQLAKIETMFATRNRQMPERNRVQAMFPQGSEPLNNPAGTAPGIWMKVGSSHVAALPGVPSEMHRMYEQEVKPRILALGTSGGVLVERKINCFGAGESAIEEMVFDLTRRGHVPEVGITASDAVISLRILARAADRDQAHLQIAPIESIIRERLGKLVFGSDHEELHNVVVDLLAAKRKTLAVAEGVTAGLISHRIAWVPGSSAWYYGGVVAYDNRCKTEMLAVAPSLIETHGTVSAEVAEAMAVGCRSRWRTDLAVSTVGIAGPGGATADRPVGCVYCAVAWDGGVRSHTFNWLGTRSEIQSRTAKMALNIVRLHLLES